MTRFSRAFEQAEIDRGRAGDGNVKPGCDSPQQRADNGRDYADKDQLVHAAGRLHLAKGEWDNPNCHQQPKHLKPDYRIKDIDDHLRGTVSPSGNPNTKPSSLRREISVSGFSPAFSFPREL